MAAEKHYLALNGLDWLDPKTGKPVRVEIGERADHVPTKSVGWLLERGYIEPCDANGKPLKKAD